MYMCVHIGCSNLVPSPHPRGDLGSGNETKVTFESAAEVYDRWNG